ncbi:TlpA family protein disulfide reductase [Halococcus saccharolyticus]|uniref:Thioredoxin 2 n=1 Tax=Halococcus saccharolyticus DSM 5350 TaxID=1227455 RepID=M0MEK9_9EURY|nr:TlpA disulfide reductase family protein [Halococcus saccharolyticus]EMA43094.1 thioredoxin 2 [Halococcus saccharolyticus DSM 5350]
MKRYTRRVVLGSGGGVALATLAGCSGVLGGADGSDTREIDTVAVAGSPGEAVAIHPQGQVALLDFFGTWCAPCKPQMAHLRTVVERFPDLHVLSITWEGEAAVVADFWREYEGTWPVALDPEVRTGERYGVQRIPTLLVLAADGTETWRHVGLAATDTIAAEVERTIEAG